MNTANSTVPHPRRRQTARSRAVRRLLWRSRWLTVALCCGIAASSAVSALKPPPPPMRDVLVPAHDLLPGVTIESGDLRVVSVPAALAPDGVLTDPADATGRTPAVILADGLPLTASLVEGGSVAALAPEGTVVVPVQLDAATAALLRPGDHVDVVIGVGNATVGDTPQFLARRALVLPVGVRDQDADSGGLFGGAQPSQATITLLAVDPREAPALSAASGSRTLAAVLVP